MYVSSDLTHELSIDPESEDSLGDDQRHADEGDSLIGESEVDEEKALDSPHMLIAKNQVDDEGITGQREEEDWAVEAEEDDGRRMADRAHVVHVVGDQVESGVVAEVVDARVEWCGRLLPGGALQGRRFDATVARQAN